LSTDIMGEGEPHWALDNLIPDALKAKVVKSLISRSPTMASSRPVVLPTLEIMSAL